MVATRRLNELVSATLPRLELPAGRVVVAMSGGADSAALAYLSRESGHETRAVHVDHQLPTSPLMADAAAAVAGELGIPMETRRVVISAGPSLENRAREARYRALSSFEGPVLTGHTRDDNAETIIINLIRGTGAAGLAGIPPFRPPRVYRPMLEITRSETREMASLAALPFVDDPMNRDITITRNRVRLEILPKMRELNPQLDAALSRMAGIVGADIRHLDELASSFLIGPLPASVVSTLPKVLADRLLRTALERAGIEPSSDRIERMWSVVNDESHRQDLAEGHAVARSGALVVIESADSISRTEVG